MSSTEPIPEDLPVLARSSPEEKAEIKLRALEILPRFGEKGIRPLLRMAQAPGCS